MLWRTILSSGRGRARSTVPRDGLWRRVTGRWPVAFGDPRYPSQPADPILSEHTLDVTTGIEHAHGMEVQPLGFRNCEHGIARCFWYVLRNALFERDDRQSFACGEREQQFVQLGPDSGGAVKNLVGGVVFDFCVAGSARPVLLLDARVQVPNPIDQCRDTARAAQVGGEFVVSWRTESNAGFRSANPIRNRWDARSGLHRPRAERDRRAVSPRAIGREFAISEASRGVKS